MDTLGRGTGISRAVASVAIDVRERLLDQLKRGASDIGCAPGVTGAFDYDGDLPGLPNVARDWTTVDCFQYHHEWYVLLRRTSIGISRERGASGALSGREREVAVRAAAGAPLKLIACALSVGLPTVATYLRRAQSKLRAGSRAELARAMAEEDSTATKAGTVAEFDLGGTLFRLLPAPLAPPRRWSRALSPTEMAISMAVVHGMRNADIARARRTSVRTVAAQVSTIMRKVVVGSRAELIARAVACHKSTDADRRPMDYEPGQ